MDKIYYFSHLPNITDIYFPMPEGHGKIVPAKMPVVEMLACANVL
jgi:hypothetical protein